MASNLVQITRRGFGETMRRDGWWVQSLLVFLGFSAFIVYSTWAAFQGEHYTFGPYLSPMYSPEIFGASPHAIFGPMPSWIPTWLPLTPAFLILWAPGGFRFTCYYYRGAYYKAFWADPVACSVGEPRSGYRGENWFPLIFQNVHRYFLYIALLFILFLSYDAYNAMWFYEEGGPAHFGIGVGTLVMIINVILLGSYTLGCHSLRHLIGGARNVLSGRPLQKKAYDCVSSLNKRHMMFAWFSLFWVGFTDFYIRMCSMNIFTDYRIL